jgi:hypothetical protein
MKRKAFAEILEEFSCLGDKREGTRILKVSLSLVFNLSEMLRLKTGDLRDKMKT